MKYTAFLTAASALVLASMLAVAPAQAQTADETATDNAEIVVTAQRRQENARDVPITVTTLDQEQLDVANVKSLGDTVKITPGLRFDSQGAAVQPSIRGIGTAVTTSGGGPNVGIYVDGFFQSNPYVADFQLMRVKNIQVLKGPQGTLFGRNTTGGAILVTTADPSTEAAGEFRATYGKRNEAVAQGYVTFGLSSNIAVDLEAVYSRGDGHFTNLQNGDNKIGKRDAWSVRGGVKVDLSDNASVMLRYTHSEASNPMTQLLNAYVDQTGEAGFFNQVSAAGRAIYGKTSSAGLPLVYFYTPNGSRAVSPGAVNLNGPLSFKTKSDVAQGTVKADLGFAELTSYTQYRRDKTPSFADLDATALTLFNIFIGVDDESWGQEFLLNSKAGAPLQWTAGVNYFQVRDTWDVDASFGTPFFDFGGSSTTTKSYAAFLDLTYQVSEKFFITAGGRYSHDLVADSYFTTNPFTTSYTGPTGLPVAFTGAPGTRIPVQTLSNDSFTPRLVLRYKPSEDSSVYGSFTKGYKAGILNVGGLSQLPVKPENINAFEVGYKFDNRKFAVDLAGFYYDYKNLQVSSFQSGAAQIRNAASSEIYGAEAQVRYRASEAFNLNGGVALTHARYKSFPNAPFYSYCDPTAANTSLLFCVPPAFGGLGAGSLVQSLTDASGFKMQRAPDFTGNLGASYSYELFGGRFMTSANLYYTSSFYFDPEQQFRQDGYEVLSIRAQWTDASEQFTLAVFGDNLTNQRYKTQVLFNTLGIGSIWNAPKSWGVSLGYKF